MEDVTRQTYRPLSDAQKENMQKVKEAGEAYIAALNAYGHPGREKALAITNAEQSVMWAVKGITG